MSWPLASLGEVAPSRPLKKPELVDENSVWQLNLDKVESHSGVVTEKVYASAKSAGSSTHWFDERHVLYSKLRPYLNKVVLPEEQGLATTELVPLFPDKDRLDRKYLTYYLRSNSFVNWISDQVAGAKMPRVSMKVFWEHQIPLPPLNEQKRIASILDKADSVRHKRKQAINYVNDFLRSVFLDMFGNHFTTDGYKVSNKKKIMELVDYIDYRGKTPEKSEFGIPLITAKNVKKGFVSEEPREFIPEKNYLEWMTRGLPQEGDVLFTTEAPLGNAALLGCYDKVVVGQRLIALRAKGELTQEYLLYCLLNQLIQDEIYKRSSGSTVKGIRTKELYEIELPIPDIKLQEKFSKIYTKHIQSKHRLQEAIVESEHMFNSLSQKAFAGKL